MAIDQNGKAKVCARRFQQLGKGGVKRPVQALDPLEGSADRQALAIDLLRVGDDACNGTQSAHHAGGLGVGKVRQPAAEQLGIELIGFAIDIEIGPRKTRGNKRSAEADDGLEQLVDVAVLRLAQGMGIEPGGLKKCLGIDASGVGRAEHGGCKLRLRAQQLKWWRQFGNDRGAFDCGHKVSHEFGT